MDWETQVQNLADEVFAQLADAITITRQSPSAVTPATGQRTQAETSTTVQAVRGRTFTQVTDAGRMRRRVYSVKAADLSYRPDAGDLIADGGKTYTVVKTAPSLDKLAWEITVERRMKA